MLPEELKHRFVETNGIQMHIAECGSGPLVILLHGFPELWYAWRHQLGPLADAGFHVVAPDLRGYGQTDRPDALEAYDIFQLTGDIVGLVYALKEKSAVVVGHDWGSWIAAHLALFRPDLFRAVGLVSVPYVPRRRMNQTQWEQETYPGKVFYQAALRSPMAERLLKTDVRASLLRSLYSLSAQAAPHERFQPAREPGPPRQAIVKRPPWITAEDVDVLEEEFTRTGFTGGLNYYRNMDRNWSLTPFLEGARIIQPAIFIAGNKDPVLEFHREEFEDLEKNVPNLRKKVVLPEVGHWTQQEWPDAVSHMLIDFLRGLPQIRDAQRRPA